MRDSRARDSVQIRERVDREKGGRVPPLDSTLHSGQAVVLLRSLYVIRFFYLYNIWIIRFRMAVDIPFQFSTKPYFFLITALYHHLLNICRFKVVFAGIQRVPSIQSSLFLPISLLSPCFYSSPPPLLLTLWIITDISPSLFGFSWCLLVAIKSIFIAGRSWPLTPASMS